MSYHDILTTRDAVTLGRILLACQRGDRVRWLNVGDRVSEGVARCVGDAHGNRLPEDVDVRSGYLRISDTFEHFIEVMVAVELVHLGHMTLEAR